MIKVVGRVNCVNCEMAKKTLKRKGIDFEYSLLEDLGDKEREDLISKAREKGMATLPLILNDENELTNLQEVFASVK